ncbi:hypothetical protein H257_04212 [Aphanomyces astaci]|uniref:RNA polymerase II-associated factor 1 homolog n=1 Tax=Aphanomyces astaci TaxID=112090 RepID=W4GVZ0_APHAT|nr:hypothetical protein H257_04212 [Aphanomyces astaci]ETV83491.1 hypothetical protein H257_04212 [Aphanomyces astaci]|eukprot:XP_009826921.1 hypothetical protein H257_04212 [Aphanomyces astaci]
MNKPGESTTTARRDDKPREYSSSSHGEKKRSREDDKKMNEMDRRKIQKYKDDKLKERKDHTRRVLEQQAQEKRRALLGKQSEFIGTLEFRNQLPDLPFDAKFIQYAHDADRFVKYKPSQVERDYVHEFYVEQNLGLPIDLIDPEKFEVPDVSERAMTNVDVELLNMPEIISGASAAKAKIRPHVPWLRRSEFMGTDLSEAVHQFKNESELQVEIRDKNQAMLSVIMQKDLEQRANESFDLCPAADNMVHPLKADLKPVQVWDVFPDEILSSNIYSILSYDILPSTDTRDPTTHDRESHALLRNVVTVSQPNAADVLLGSILFPSTGHKAVGGGDTHDSDEDGGSEKFKFFRDYVLNINHFPNDVQQLMLMINPDATSATYASLSTNITLKKTKIGGDSKRRRGAVVHRRAYNDAEEEKRTESLLTVGGIYDERLNGMVGHGGHHVKDAQDDDVGSPDVSEEDSD